MGFKLDSDFKLEGPIGAVVRSSFFFISGNWLIWLSLLNNTSLHLGWITVTLYFGDSQSSLKFLELEGKLQHFALTSARRREHKTPTVASLHWLSLNFRVYIKILLFPNL